MAQLVSKVVTGWGRGLPVLMLFLWATLAGGGLLSAPTARAEGPSPPFNPPGLEADAKAYLDSLRAKAPPQVNPAQRDEALAQAAQFLTKRDFPKAIAAFERAVFLGENRPVTWLALAQAWTEGATPQLKRALAAGWLARQRTKAGRERYDTTLFLARLLEGALDQPEQALAGYRDAAAEAATGKFAAPELEGRIKALRLRIGLRLQQVRMEAEGDSPRACLEFNDALRSDDGAHYQDFVRLEPAVAVTFAVEGSTLCLEGLAHGAGYGLTLRQGMPGTDGVVLNKDESQRLRVPDRSPMVAFKSGAFILPRLGPEGIPLVAVNVDQVKLKLMRVHDRNLPTQFRNNSSVGEALSHYDARRISETEGELLWEGQMAVKGERNREVITGIPVRKALPVFTPGLYALTAEPLNIPNSLLPWNKATQWLVVTDLGLTSLRGEGIDVFVRSLATAKPLAGVDVALLSKNNNVLARVRSDADGRVNFPPALTRGNGGQAPLLVTAYGAEGDFAVLDLSLAAFDLTDRGVGGRAAPGPLDAFLYPDRGVYRPGELVNLSVLLRDEHVNAVDGFPLTLKVRRPGGTEFFSGVLKQTAPGAYTLPLRLSATAPMGSWSAEAFADPKGEPIGQVAFQVEDFVPEKMSVELKPAVTAAQLGEPFAVQVTGRFLYGPPAAGIAGRAEITLNADPEPFPAYKAFRFGLEQETVTPRTEEVEVPAADAQGLSTLSVTLPAAPDSTRPLRAEIRVAMTEPGGRPTRQSVTLPVRTHTLSVGIRPRFSALHVGEGEGAAFEFVVLDSEGQPMAASGLKMELLAEHRDFQWYWEEGRYKYRTNSRDEMRLRETLALPRPGVIARDFGPLPQGRYRLEISDAASGAATSVRFWSGWGSSPDQGDTPDMVEVSADKAVYAPGETAVLAITPPFAGEAQITVVSNRVLAVQSLTVPAGGTTVRVPVSADWGPGAYVLTQLYRPPVKGKERVPVRAIGVSWLAVDPAARSLTVSLDAPEAVLPRGPAEVVVRVAAAGNQPRQGDAWVTLAAVDEGILQLTRFASPDPVRHYMGKRLLGVDVRDDYGKLIDAVDGPMGTLRSGGDGGLAGGLPKVPFLLVSLFQGPVKVDARGEARVRLDVPDFTGQLRLMAVAFDGQRVGSASGRMLIRDPLVAEAVLPRFLAPGDQSRLTLSLHNVAAPAGRYRVGVQGLSPVEVGGLGPDGAVEAELAPGARQTLALPLTAASAGIAGVRLHVTGPVGAGAGVFSAGSVDYHREYGLTVRPSRPVETDYMVREMPPGGEFRADAALFAAYVPGTAGAAVSFATAPPFDVSGLLAALDRYPYGCLEQVVSRALPLLAVNAVADAAGRPKARDAAAATKVDQAITQVLDKQRWDGGFGVWSANGDASPWLDAYAAEFLTRARKAGQTVPDAPYLAVLEHLRREVIDGGTRPVDIAARAYGLHVLALAGVLTPGPARYFHDTFGARLPSPLAAAQLAAALARLGQRERAEEVVAGAMSRLARNDWHEDYGSTVRDAAGIITVLGEVGMLTPHLRRLLDRLPATETAVNRTSTQEQAWLVLAARTLLGDGKAGGLSLAGSPLPKADPAVLSLDPAQLAQGVAVRNTGSKAVWQAVSVHGVPLTPSPAAREGLRVKRYFFKRDGSALDLDTVRQNDVFVVVLEGESGTRLFHQALLTQPLPAGWEVENKRLGAGGLDSLAWLKDLTQAKAAELRDDRYIAAVDMDENHPRIKLAFLVRAVTPGSYELPGAVLEDMYKPRFFARQGAGRITVQEPAGP